MLQSLRKSAGSIVAKVFIVMLILSFGIWGITDFLTSQANVVLATVEGVDIDLYTTRQEYLTNFQRLSSSRASPPTEEEKREIARQVLNQRIAAASVQSLGSELELVAPPSLIRSLGGFRTRQDEVRTQARIVESQLLTAFARDAAVPNDLVDELMRIQLERKNVTLVKVPLSAISLPEPTASDLRSYYSENLDFYALDETRIARLLIAQTDDIVLDKALVRAEYDGRIDSFHQPERRSFRQLAFGKREDASRAVTELASGTSFDDIAVKYGDRSTFTVFDDQTRPDVPSEELASVVFSTALGDNSQVIDSPLTSFVVQVTRVSPGVTASFETIEPLLTAQLTRRAQQEAATKLIDSIEDLRAEGMSLVEISNRLAIELTTVGPIDRGGSGANRETDPNLPHSPSLIADIFATEIDLETDPTPLPGEVGYVFVELTDIIDAHDRSFDEVRELVEEDWRADKSSELALDMANDITENLSPIDQVNELSLVAIAANYPLQTALMLNVQEAATELNIPIAAALAVYGVPDNQPASLRTDDGAIVVLNSNSTIDKDEVYNRIRDSISETFDREYQEELADAVREISMKHSSINQASDAIDRILQEDPFGYF